MFMKHKSSIISLLTWLIQGRFQPEKVPESAVDKDSERRGEEELPSSLR